MKLTKETVSLLVIAILATAGMVVVGTFINVFLIRATAGNLSLIIIQNMVAFISGWIAFVTGTKLLKKTSVTTLLKFGLLLMIAYLAIVLALQAHLATFLIPIAFFNGFGGGLYWFSINLLIAGIIKEQEQGRYFGYQQTTGSILGVITPTISGFIITRFTDLTGYYILFAIALFFYLFSLYMTKNIPKFTSSTDIRLSEVLKLKGNRYFNAGKSFRFIIALRDTINGQVFMLYAFLIFNNEGIIGNILSATAVIAIFSSFWFAKIYTRRNQQRFYLTVAIMKMTIYVLLAIFPYVPVLIGAWIVFAVIQNWAATVLQSVIFQLSSRAKGGFETNDYITALEFPATVGRIIGMGFALLMIQLIPSVLLVYRLLFVVIAIAWILEYVVIEKQVGWFRDEFTSSG